MKTTTMVCRRKTKLRGWTLGWSTKMMRAEGDRVLVRFRGRKEEGCWSAAAAAAVCPQTGQLSIFRCRSCTLFPFSFFCLFFRFASTTVPRAIRVIKLGTNGFRVRLASRSCSFVTQTFTVAFICRLLFDPHSRCRCCDWNLFSY